MIKSTPMKNVSLAVSLLLACASTWAQKPSVERVEASRCHVFIDHENIWTLEVNIDDRQPIPILNIITFGEEELPFRPEQIHIYDQKGRRAGVNRLSIDTGVPGDPYVTDFLQVLESSFIGMDLVGDFANFEEPAKVQIELGEHEFTLQPIDCLDFETLVQKIDQINFNSPNLKEDYDVLQVPLLGSKGPARKGRR